jgi:hypothetical protein
MSSPVEYRTCALCGKRYDYLEPSSQSTLRSCSELCVSLLRHRDKAVR